MKDSQFSPGLPNNCNGQVMSSGGGGGRSGREEGAGRGGGYQHWPPHPLQSHPPFRSHHASSQLPRMMGSYLGVGGGGEVPAAHLASGGGWSGPKPPDRWTSSEGGIDLSQSRSNGVPKEPVSVIAANPLRTGDKPLETSDRSEDEDEDCMVIEEGEEAPRTGELPPTSRQAARTEEPSVAPRPPPRNEELPMSRPIVEVPLVSRLATRTDATKAGEMSLASRLAARTDTPKTGEMSLVSRLAARTDTLKTGELPLASRLAARTDTPRTGELPPVVQDTPPSVVNPLRSGGASASGEEAWNSAGVGRRQPQPQPHLQAQPQPQPQLALHQFAKQILAQKQKQDSQHQHLVTLHKSSDAAAYHQLLSQHKLVTTNQAEAVHQLLQQGVLASVLQPQILGRPEAARHEAARSAAARPEPSQPMAARHEAARPEVSQPAAARPEVSQPVGARHEAARPEAARHEAARPEAARHEAARPEAAHSEAARPEAAHSEAARPEAAQPVAARHEAARPEAARLEAARPEAAQPMAARHEASRPEAARHEAARPEVARDEASRPEMAKHEAAQPEAARHEAARPEAARHEAARPEAARHEAAGPEAARHEMTGPQDARHEMVKPDAGRLKATGPESARLAASTTLQQVVGMVQSSLERVESAPHPQTSPSPAQPPAESGSHSSAPPPPSSQIIPMSCDAVQLNVKDEVKTEDGTECSKNKSGGSDSSVKLETSSAEPASKVTTGAGDVKKEEGSCVDQVESMLENMFQQDMSGGGVDSEGGGGADGATTSEALTEDKVVQILEDHEVKTEPSTPQKSSSTFMQVESELEKMFAGIVEMPGMEEGGAGSVGGKKWSGGKRNKGRPRKSKDKRGRSPHSDSPAPPRKRAVPASHGVHKGDRLAEASNDSSTTLSTDHRQPQVGRARGPYIRVRQGCVRVVNSGSGSLAEESSRDHRDSALKRNTSRIAEGRTRGPGLYSSTLSSKYNSTLVDVTWTCVFCNKRSHCDGGLGGEAAGDLFGPYLVQSRGAEGGSGGGPSDAEVVSEQRRRGGGKQLSLRAGGTPHHAFTPPHPKRKGSVSEKDGAVAEGSRDVWVHEGCAVWAPGVILVGPHLIGLDHAVSLSAQSKCGVCGEKGACVWCVEHGCGKVCHYGCARASRWCLDEETFHARCHNHTKATTLSQALQQSSI